MDIITSSPRYSFGKGVLCRLKDLGFPFEFPDLICVSRASLYRVACKSKVIAASSELILAANASDDALFRPRLREWASHSSFENLLSNKR
eukprot:14556032-Heterocapsa_arctica.AAC.1